MAQADLLRIHDVRAAYRLIGDCRDLGSDPALWQPRLFEGLSRMFDVAATGGEGRLVGSPAAVVPLSHFHSGFDAKEIGTYQSYMTDGGPAADPFVRAFPPVSTGAVTHTRRQIVADRVYYRSHVFDRYFQPGNVGHRLASMFPTRRDAISFLHVHRPPRARDFSSREQALLNFVHVEIGPLVGRALVSAAEPTPANLPPRLRQTLACLIEGDTEKQVATRLGVTRATIHEYVTTLYRRFGVNSRGQLLAHVLKRVMRQEWKDGLNLGSLGTDQGIEPPRGGERQD